jgi:hypothetical protein
MYSNTKLSWLGLTENAPYPRCQKNPRYRGPSDLIYFEDVFLYLLDELSLGDSSRQCRHNVNVIRNTADMHEVGAKITADCRQISMHPGSHVLVEPWFAVFSAKDDVKDDLA